MGFNCLKATDPLRGSSLLFTTKFPGISRLGMDHLGNPTPIYMTDPLIFIKSWLTQKNKQKATMANLVSN